MTRDWLGPFDLSDRRLDASPPDVATGPAEPAVVAAPVADLRAMPDLACRVDTQVLLGASLGRLARRDGWSFVRAEADGYVGWTRDEGLAEGTSRCTHVVRAQRAPAFPVPDMKFPVLRFLSMGSRVEVVGEAETRGTRYCLLASGEAVAATQVRPAPEFDDDPVAVARRLLGTPYVWGGGSAFGVDCSGLVQLAFAMCGRRVLRDSDMQAATLGVEIAPGDDFAGLRRGDLVFWRGHAAMVEGDGKLLHSNGFTMDVTSEPLRPALARIAANYSPPVCFRRP